MIEVGEYVINQNRLVIGQIIEINEERQEAIIKVNRLELLIGFWNIKKHSKNLIDLIEVSDYVNGMKIDDIGEIKRFGKTTQKCLWVNIGDGIDIIDEEIKDILTKEQYMQNCYKIAEESSSIN